MQAVRIYNPIPHEEEAAYAEAIIAGVRCVLPREQLMSRTATYHTRVTWKGEHWGHIQMGNGPEMEFSAPPDAARDTRAC